MTIEYPNRKLLYGRLLVMAVFIICLSALTRTLNGSYSSSTSVVLWLMLFVFAGAFVKCLIDMFREMRFRV